MELLSFIPAVAWWAAVGLIALVVVIKILITLRRVVPTNEVHVLQGAGKTRDYGAKSSNGTTYYAFPAWLPFLGVVIRPLPISNFTIELDDYEAYDQGKVPFEVTVKAFFRVEDANEAAVRVENFNELKEQLLDILQGAIRSILAEYTIEEIMVERNKFGERFSEIVDPHLIEWGVKSVKNIELMDIQDADNSEVITNIQAKNRTKIEMESRIEVAKNNKDASVAEIQAIRDAEVADQEAQEQVGERTAEKQKKIGVAEQLAQQEITVQQTATAEREMELERVNDVKAAQIAKDVTIVQAEAEAKQKVVEAGGLKEQAIEIAKGQKESEVLRAQGIKATGGAEADVIDQKEKAQVAGQIALATKIAEMPAYMKYLLGIKHEDIVGVVGEAQAAALEKADVKVLATGDKGAAIGNIFQALTTPEGGAKIGAMMDAMKDFGDGSGLSKIIKGFAEKGTMPSKEDLAKVKEELRDQGLDVTDLPF